MSDYYKKRCQLCDARISSDPKKNNPVAFVAGKCNTCWTRINAPRDNFSPSTDSQAVALKAIDTTDPAWRYQFYGRS